MPITGQLVKEDDDGKQGQKKRQEEAEEDGDQEVKSAEREVRLERERDEKAVVVWVVL